MARKTTKAMIAEVIGESRDPSKIKNALEQMTEAEQSAVAQLVGFETVGPAFRNNLRDILPLMAPWTIGDMTRAYLKARLAELS